MTMTRECEICEHQPVDGDRLIRMRDGIVLCRECARCRRALRQIFGVAFATPEDYDRAHLIRQPQERTILRTF